MLSGQLDALVQLHPDNQHAVLTGTHRLISVRTTRDALRKVGVRSCDDHRLAVAVFTDAYHPHDLFLRRESWHRIPEAATGPEH